jgi:hypothetical protein
VNFLTSRLPKVLREWWASCIFHLSSGQLAPHQPL